ncbi:hypothetical protein E2C01_029394 [Portunus trituberculatus]|uniref:Uncharacterized protein n=1 Tax=Portunus trituberculatus TaxID=210409 RepID=A0A5B7ERC7_PORTR|nr:hypothetical protein [Portunus trituberculatus]
MLYWSGGETLPTARHSEATIMCGAQNVYFSDSVSRSSLSSQSPGPEESLIEQASHAGLVSVWPVRPNGTALNVHHLTLGAESLTTFALKKKCYI